MIDALAPLPNGECAIERKTPQCHFRKKKLEFEGTAANTRIRLAVNRHKEANGKMLRPDSDDAAILACGWRNLACRQLRRQKGDFRNDVSFEWAR
jgi:hypothetical protein